MSPHLPHLHRHEDEPDPSRRAPREPLQGPALRLTVFLGEYDQYRHRSLFAEVVHQAHRAGLAGASVFRGIEGFGAGSMVHTSRLLDLAEDLPIAVVVVDTEDRIRGFLPLLRELAPDHLVTLDPVQAVPPAGEEDPAAGEKRPAVGAEDLAAGKEDAR